MALESILGPLATEQTSQDILTSVDASNTALGGINTSVQGVENAIGDGNDLAAQIRQLNDTMLYFCAAMLDKMARLDTNDRMAVRIEAIDATNSSLSVVSSVTNVTNLANLGTTARAADLMPQHMSNIGAFHLYNNILVT